MGQKWHLLIIFQMSCLTAVPWFFFFFFFFFFWGGGGFDDLFTDCEGFQASEKIQYYLYYFTLFSQGLEELDKTRESQHAALQSELKKEMQLLQKRILMDTVSLNILLMFINRRCTW